MLLSKALRDRENGLTQSRIVLAFFVLFDHAYAINGEIRPNLGSLPISLSEIAVWLFIFMSGLLCCRSAESHSARRYLTLRLGRLMPGYWACLLLTGLLFMPVMHWIGLSGQQSLAQLPKTVAEFWAKNLLLTQGQFAPAGWLESLPVQAINGSMWTLQPEFMGYIIILFLGPCLARKTKESLLTFCGFTVIAVFYPEHLRQILDILLRGYGFELANLSYIKLALFLVSGICFYCLSDRIELRTSWAVAATGILLTASAIHPKLFALLLPAAMPYIFITLVGLIKWPWKARAGDISYGFYLYSFPVQQIVYTIGAGWSLIAQVITATATVIPLAMLSWHYIEQPAMQWLNKKDSRQTRSLDVGDPDLANSLDARSVSPG